MHKNAELVPHERIERLILLIRGHKVILDADLAALYGVETKQLIRAVKRNLPRFPSDFMFQLNEEESENLRFHFGTSSQWGGDQKARPATRALRANANFRHPSSPFFSSICQICG
jgi:hypothetical protein